MQPPRPDHPRPYHRNSVFGEGPRRPLDRNTRARWRCRLHCHARAGQVTRAERDALSELADHLSHSGRCDPSHARLADCSRTSVSTVQRALAAGRDLGLLDWQRRIVRAGWRAEQTSNAYVLIDPITPPPALPAVRAPLKAKILESDSSVSLTVAALPVLHPTAQAARIAAKMAAERATRAAHWQAIYAAVARKAPHR